jgi:hypothetical protein
VGYHGGLLAGSESCEFFDGSYRLDDRLRCLRNIKNLGFSFDILNWMPQCSNSGVRVMEIYRNANQLAAGGSAPVILNGASSLGGPLPMQEVVGDGLHSL